jgi:hypothetical protein
VSPFNVASLAICANSNRFASITMLFSLISVIFDLLIVVFTGIRWYQLWRTMKLTEGDLAILIMRNGQSELI